MPGQGYLSSSGSLNLHRLQGRLHEVWVVAIFHLICATQFGRVPCNIEE